MKRWLLPEMVSFIKQICMPSDYLTITGMGYALGEDKFTLEYNFYARDQHNTTQVCYNRVCDPSAPPEDPLAERGWLLRGNI